MYLRNRRNLFLLAVLHVFIFMSFLPGCKEGTKDSPVSSLITNYDIDPDNYFFSGRTDAIYTLTGNVVASGTGIASSTKIGDITVKLLYENTHLMTTHTTSTDGAFYFYKLPPGLYDLHLSSERLPLDKQYFPATYVMRILNNGSISPASASVVLDKKP